MPSLDELQASTQNQHPININVKLNETVDSDDSAEVRPSLPTTFTMLPPPESSFIPEPLNFAQPGTCLQHAPRTREQLIFILVQSQVGFD
jgi:hypothetical protein